MFVFVSMIADDQVWRAEDDGQLIKHLDALFTDRRGAPRAVSMIARLGWAWGPVGKRSDTVDHRLRVAVDLDGGWGALNFLHARSPGIWCNWNSVNPHPDGQAPSLAVGRFGLVFSANAALPLQVVYDAAVEYGRTAARPVNIVWQQAHFL